MSALLSFPVKTKNGNYATVGVDADVSEMSIEDAIDYWKAEIAQRSPELQFVDTPSVASAQAPVQAPVQGNGENGIAVYRWDSRAKEMATTRYDPAPTVGSLHIPSAREALINNYNLNEGSPILNADRLEQNIATHVSKHKHMTKAGHLVDVFELFNPFLESAVFKLYVNGQQDIDWIESAFRVRWDALIDTHNAYNRSRNDDVDNRFLTKLPEAVVFTVMKTVNKSGENRNRFYQVVEYVAHPGERNQQEALVSPQPIQQPTQQPTPQPAQQPVQQQQPSRSTGLGSVINPPF